MKGAIRALGSLFLFSQLVTAQTDYGSQFSNFFSTGPITGPSWIRESCATLVLPKTNSPQTGNLALWPGMATTGGDLIQALAISVIDGKCVPPLVDSFYQTA